MTDSNDKDQRKSRPLNVVTALLGECLCEPSFLASAPSSPVKASKGATLKTNGPAWGTPFLQLHGIEFISLGAVTNELTPKQRIDDTLEQLTPQRLIHIGYLDVDTKATQSVALEAYQKHYPNDRNHLQRPFPTIIQHIMDKRYESARKEFQKLYEKQKNQPNRGSNQFLAGINAHNVAVLHVLEGHAEAALTLFRQAVVWKKLSFGETHTQVALSLDEIGIQLFAQKEMQPALHAMNDSRKIAATTTASYYRVMILNNQACVHLNVGNHVAAMLTLRKARDLWMQQQQPPQPQDDDVQAGSIDLLHRAITLGNLGYCLIQLKQYEEARSILEETLLIQQSVLGDDNHRAIRDTRSNLEFTNVFHS